MSLNWKIALGGLALWVASVVWYIVSHWGDSALGDRHTASRETVLAGSSETRLLEVMERFPKQAGPAAAYAGLALERRDYDEALRRYHEAIRRDRKDIRGHMGVVRTLRQAGRLDEAEAFVLQARRRFPADEHLQIHFVQIAEQRGDWPEVVRRWEAFRRRYPANRESYTHCAAALRKCGRAADADALLAKAAERFAPQKQAATAGS